MTDTYNIAHETAHEMPTRGKAEAAVAQWASSMRESFGKDRKGFNFAICDALAAQGIQPTPHGVLRVGHWGQAASIAQDVSEWYRTLAERLSSMEARIPISARRHANTLLEQLFAVATNEAAKTLDAQLQPLHDETARLHAALKEALLHQHQLQQDKQALIAAESLGQQRLQERQDQLDAVQITLNEQQARHTQVVSELAAKQQQLHDELLASTVQLHEQQARFELTVAAAKEHLACVREEHAQETLKASQQADIERRRLMQSIDNVRVESANRLKDLQSDLGHARTRHEALQENVQASALATATAQALLDGANKLLEREREHFTQAQVRYESLPYRQELLLAFLNHAPQAGLRFACNAADQPQVAAWLRDDFSLNSATINKLMGSLQQPEQFQSGRQR